MLFLILEFFVPHISKCLKWSELVNKLVKTIFSWRFKHFYISLINGYLWFPCKLMRLLEWKGSAFQSLKSPSLIPRSEQFPVPVSLLHILSAVLRHHVNITLPCHPPPHHPFFLSYKLGKALFSKMRLLFHHHFSLECPPEEPSNK